MSRRSSPGRLNAGPEGPGRGGGGGGAPRPPEKPAGPPARRARAAAARRRDRRSSRNVPPKTACVPDGDSMHRSGPTQRSGDAGGHAEAGSDDAGPPPVALQPQPSGVPARNNAAGAPGPPGAAREGGHMPTEAKRATVAELTTILEASTSSIVADYRGLKVSEISAVRRSLREKGIGYHVIKNLLTKIAAEQAGIAELSPLLPGPTAPALGPGG